MQMILKNRNPQWRYWGSSAFSQREVNAELIAYKPDTYTIPFILMSADTSNLRAAIQAQYGERAKRLRDMP